MHIILKLLKMQLVQMQNHHQKNKDHIINHLKKNQNLEATKQKIHQRIKNYFLEIVNQKENLNKILEKDKEILE